MGIQKKIDELGDFKWQPLSISEGDLKLMEDIECSAQQICSAFNYPYALLGLPIPSCDEIKTEDAEFEIIEPKQIENDKSK